MKHFRKTTNKHLGELLVERGVVTRSQVQEAVDYQKANSGLMNSNQINTITNDDNLSQCRRKSI